MRALFLTQYPELAPSPRYRVYQMIPFLESRGVECTVQSLLSEEEYLRTREQGRYLWKTRAMLRAFRRRMQLIDRLSEYDVVYVLKRAFPYGPPLIEHRIRKSGVPMIFDFDDAIHLGHASVSHRLLDIFRFHHRIADTIRTADHVMAANEYLADFAKGLNRRVTIVEEAEDTDRFTQRPPHTDSGNIIIGWIGSHSTAPWVKLIEPALREICRRYPHVKIRIVGGRFAVRDLPVEHVPWSLEREVENFHQLDIGIMPLPLNEWSKGKCGCKLRQYMAAGVPGVATRIGYNCELVEEGVTGFLAESHDEWVSALDRLVRDADLRNRIADAARQSVVERYSIPVIGPQYFNVLRATARVGSYAERRKPFPAAQ